jgi:predicted RNA-binding Zn ribbon-like protein
MQFLFLGNTSWLDLVNTELHDGRGPVDLLADFDHLMKWAREGELVDEALARAIAGRSSQVACERAFQEARVLRAELRQAAERMARGEAVAPALIARVNEILREHPSALQLHRRSSAWVAEAEDLRVGPRSILARVAEDFAHFLTLADPSLVRRCESPPCMILFHDTSRNRARRWCSMKICGNRSKVARHRARQAP